MRRDYATFPQRSKQQLEIRLLEQTLGRAFRITAVRNDDIKLVLLVRQELEPISDMHRHIWVLKPNAHARKIFFGQPDDRFVDITKYGRLHGRMFHNFTQDTTVATADNEYMFWVWVRVQSKVGDHFLIAGG